jgi:hypothetical protein
MDSINAGRLPSQIVPLPVSRGAVNDNTPLLKELRELRQEVVRLQKIVMAGDNMNAKATANSGAVVAEAVEDSGKRTAFAITQNAKDNKAA